MVGLFKYIILTLLHSSGDQRPFKHARNLNHLVLDVDDTCSRSISQLYYIKYHDTVSGRIMREEHHKYETIGV